MNLYPHYREVGREISVARAVENHVGRTDHSGEVERAREIADQCAEAFGELVEMLADKGILNAKEVFRFTGWNVSEDTHEMKP